MHYTIKAPFPSSRYLEIELTLHNVNDDELILYLPSWRPGRYETGNFSKNIQFVKAFDEHNNTVLIRKQSKDSWALQTSTISSLVVRYTYYAAQPDAGACYIDNELVYFNPVHCCIYAEDRLHLPCTLQLDVPEQWKIATGLVKTADRLYKAADYHQLADSPVLSSPSLLHKSYLVNGIEFTIWLSGKCNPDWERIIKDFQAFTTVQLDMMGSFPARDYHFLVLLLPYTFYHGVEHTNSTVLALGPGYALMKDNIYNDFLGVASHELFHAWNVKTIRPAEMLPYRYREENYSRAGWVYEGFTTYYGDLFLARSGFFNVKLYLEELSVRLQKHMDNYGRFNYAVTESSFDTWLDGYVPGVPHRKTSIYDEGCLIALVLDLFIRRHSGWEFSLDNVMQSLYKDFALQNRGYREQDIKMLVEHYAGTKADMLFKGMINAAVSYKPFIDDLLHDVGCYISIQPSKNIYEDLFGFRIVIESGVSKVSAVAPGSPAFIAGLSKDDELICLNNMKIENNLNDLTGMFSDKQMQLEVFTLKEKKSVLMNKSDEHFYTSYAIVPSEDADEQQRKRFTKWTGIGVS